MDEMVNYYADPTTLISREELFKTARIAQTGCMHHNSVEPYNSDNYDMWYKLKISCLTILFGTENAYYASDFLMDNEGSPLTLREMDDWMQSC